MTVIIEDSRQKRGKHEAKRQYFLDQGHIVVRQQMKWGDYGLYPSVVVDTKANIIEIAQNLCGSVAERNRFTKEMKTAWTNGITIVFLIEDKRFKDKDDLIGCKLKLHDGRTIKGEQLMTSMSICEIRYRCEFQFCSPDDVGHRIIEILEGGK